MTIDHIVISVKSLKKSIAFYESFLGKPKVTKWDASWKVGNTKFFLTSAYKKDARIFDKHNFGLNHIALGVSSIAELKKYKRKLVVAKIKHSEIQIDKYGKTPFFWFDDPDAIRLEFYLQ